MQLSVQSDQLGSQVTRGSAIHSRPSAAGGVPLLGVGGGGLTSLKGKLSPLSRKRKIPLDPGSEQVSVSLISSRAAWAWLLGVTKARGHSAHNVYEYHSITPSSKG